MTDDRTPQTIPDAYALSVDEVLERVDSTPEGLTSGEAEKRIDVLGPNSLPDAEKRTLPSMIIDQFKDFLIILLIGAAIISGFLGEMVDTIAIIVIVVINAAIGVVQEYRAERAMEALKKMAAVVATVRRDGREVDVPADDLTIGDIVLLDAGRSVPADMRVIEAAHLRAAEASLTGESHAVDKTTRTLDDEDACLGDRIDMVYRGTQIVNGRGAGVVTAVGLDTELGKIAGLLGETGDVKTPLQKRLAQFGRGLGIIAIALSALVFILGVLRGEDVFVILLTAISLAVAAVPEALPAVATVTLAIGARKLVKTHALVRKLPAVETLGSVTFICTDKTGTLTINCMTAERMRAGGATFASLADSSAATTAGRWLTEAMAVSNDVVEREGELVGDPTEVALVVASAESEPDRDGLIARLERVDELPFDSDRKLMTTVHTAPDGGLVAFTKGAAEQVLGRSQAIMNADGSEGPLDREAMLATVDEWSADGLRVLAFAMRRLDRTPEEVHTHTIENELVLLGIVGLVDPPRPEAAEAVETCKQAGIVPVMITGDHPATALNIAGRIGIANDPESIMTGPELDALDLHHFEQRVEDVRVYARVAPEQKLKIVEALQDKGEFVAMTGDGVNDAPALARADIGISMGITGTDVAKEASSMILTDDNFASIVLSVREGRRIFDNIRKFIKYTMTSNSGEIYTILLAPFFGMPIPLLPIHILWINLVTDGLPGLAFAAEPTEPGIMKRAPRPPKESIFADGLGIHLVWVGLLMGAATLSTQAIAMATGMHWQTMVFTVLCFSQMGHALAIRSDRLSLFKQGVMSNRAMAGAIALTIVAQLAVIYVPFLQPIFRTEALSGMELAIALLMSTIVFWAVEIEKAVKRWRDTREAAGKLVAKTSEA